jgi:hypothetical protein
MGAEKMSELDRFVVYKPCKLPVCISAHEKYIAISAGAYIALGKPEYVNVFLEECGNRVMIKKADKKMPNAMKIIEHQAGSNRCLCNKDLAKIVSGMWGHGTHIMGHLVDDCGMIFDREEKNNGRAEKV